MKNFEELVNKLCSLKTFGVRPGIENTQKILEALAKKKPLPEPKFLHIAGTNGKGSVAAFLFSILREANFKTGLYTSPHLIRLTERIQIDGEEISEERFCEIAELVSEIINKEGRNLTFFEYLTVIAWEYFREEGVPYVVWETGLGGRLDATTAQKPFVTLITNIGLEHTEYLGDTLEKIAAEKGGIIFPLIPNFTTAQAPAAAIIAEIAEKNHAPNTQVSFTEGFIEPNKHFISVPNIGLYNAEPGLLGHFQLENAALAASAAHYVLSSAGLSAQDVQMALLLGLKRAKWPGRLQLLNKAPYTLLDCAHNAHGWQALAKSLNELKPNETWKIYFGMLKEKNPAEAIRILEPLAKTFNYVEPQNERKLTGAEWKSLAPKDGRFEKIFTSAKEALEDLKNQPETENILLCGSCYLAGEFLALIEGRERDNRTDDPLKTKI